MPRLVEDLQARLYKISPDDPKVMVPVETLEQAQGVMFKCPLCFKKNGGIVGTHSVICWFAGRGVPDDRDPKPGRWTPAGSGLHDLTFVPGDPPRATSVLLNGGCGWHGFVSSGSAD